MVSASSHGFAAKGGRRAARTALQPTRKPGDDHERNQPLSLFDYLSRGEVHIYKTTYITGTSIVILNQYMEFLAQISDVLRWGFNM